MKIGIGDKVSFLDQGGIGEVVEIVSANTVMVLVDGMEIPYKLKDIVLVSSIKKEIIEETSKNINSLLELAANTLMWYFFNDNNIKFASNHLKSALVNTSEYDILVQIRNNSATILQEKLPSKSVKTFDTISLNNFKSKKDIYIQIVYSKPIGENFAPIVMEIPCVELNFLMPQAYKLVLETYTASYCIWNFNPIVTKDFKFAEPEPTKPKPIVPTYFTLTETNNLEVDLHIENLVDYPKRMDSFAIVQHQLAIFNEALTFCYKNNISKLIVIHGVGKGVLKNEILNLLLDYPNLEYYDAAYHKYGFGATEVVVRR